jgi:hypothetical protein
MAVKKNDRVFVNPFSEAFTPIWELWKVYKKEQWSFTYKSVITEQAAMEDLVELSGGIESTAILIVKQSIKKGWRGFFKLKTENNNTNGQRTNTQQTGNPAETRQSLNDYYNNGARKWG